MSSVSTVNILKERLQKALKQQEDDDEGANEESCGDCLDRLDEIEMTLDILTETLIGATVTKFKGNAKWGPKAKALIKKWKQIAKKDQKPKLKKRGSNASSASSSAAAASANNSSSGYSPSEEWADLPPNRQNMCQKFYPLLALAKPSLVQAGMNADAVDTCLAKLAAELETAIHHKFSNDRKAYTDKARSIAFNLKKNYQLTMDMVFGAHQPDEVVLMTSEQLQSAEEQQKRAAKAAKLNDAKRLDWEQANEAKINEMCGIKGDLLKASLFTCGRCKSVKTTSTQKQTRSADEPMTVFVLCMNCGNRWKC